MVKSSSSHEPQGQIPCRLEGPLAGNREAIYVRVRGVKSVAVGTLTPGLLPSDGNSITAAGLLTASDSPVVPDPSRFVL